MILDINHGPTLAEVKDNIAEDAVLDYVFMQAYGMGLIIEYCINYLIIHLILDIQALYLLL